MIVNVITTKISEAKTLHTNNEPREQPHNRTTAQPHNRKKKNIK